MTAGRRGQGAQATLKCASAISHLGDSAQACSLPSLILSCPVSGMGCWESLCRTALPRVGVLYSDPCNTTSLSFPYFGFSIVHFLKLLKTPKTMCFKISLHVVMVSFVQHCVFLHPGSCNSDLLHHCKAVPGCPCALPCCKDKLPV